MFEKRVSRKAKNILFLRSGTICSYTRRMWTFPIIEKLGGRHAVAALVRRVQDGAAVPLTVDTVRMWIARSSIPGYAVRQMMEEAERRGIEVGARDFERCHKPQREAA